MSFLCLVRVRPCVYTVVLTKTPKRCVFKKRISRASKELPPLLSFLSQKFYRNPIGLFLVHNEGELLNSTRDFLVSRRKQTKPEYTLSALKKKRKAREFNRRVLSKKASETDMRGMDYARDHRWIENLFDLNFRLEQMDKSAK
ncbi:hypothetical protein GMAR_ORF12 [Golden Marseillevirus]|uniref:hypothetical protein n=1 Tax=Golden Marseillevirus TaxID=1720526 RepID=UPI000877A9E7|nr:hypothetical protein GMAR_ORF12 [Golden Marseillevirus]ALX27387.1 hypothetical protein GMAR_ORF12 [Golden Marseillevirus]